jgi:hypothetical protein
MKLIINRLNTVLNTPVVPATPPLPTPGVVLDLSTQPYNFDINTTKSIVLLAPTDASVNFVTTSITDTDNHIWGISNTSLWDVDVYQDGTLIGRIDAMATKFMHFNTFTNTLYLS